MCVAVGRRLGLRGRAIEELECAALLHDLGRTALQRAILDKPGSLDPSERNALRTHPEVAHAWVRSMGFYPRAAEIVLRASRAHGREGYPRGLDGQADSAREPHHHGCRRLRRDDVGSALPARALSGGGLRGVARQQRHPVLPRRGGSAHRPVRERRASRRVHPRGAGGLRTRRLRLARGGGAHRARRLRALARRRVRGRRGLRHPDDRHASAARRHGRAGGGVRAGARSGLEARGRRAQRHRMRAPQQRGRVRHVRRRRARPGHAAPGGRRPRRACRGRDGKPPRRGDDAGGVLHRGRGFRHGRGVDRGARRGRRRGARRRG